jgi:hypothetical protein
MVPSDGAPAEPWKTSKRENIDPNVIPAGGMNVSEAKSASTRIRKIVGNWRSRMRSAIVSYTGQDLRIVEAS